MTKLEPVSITKRGRKKIEIEFSVPKFLSLIKEDFSTLFRGLIHPKNSNPRGNNAAIGIYRRTFKILKQLKDIHKADRFKKGINSREAIYETFTQIYEHFNDLYESVMKRKIVVDKQERDELMVEIISIISSKDCMKYICEEKSLNSSPNFNVKYMMRCNKTIKSQ